MWFCFLVHLVRFVLISASTNAVQVDGFALKVLTAFFYIWPILFVHNESYRLSRLPIVFGRRQTSQRLTSWKLDK